MNLKLVSFLSLSIGALAVAAAAPVQAFSLNSLSGYTVTASPNNAPHGDVILQSIQVGSKTINKFTLVDSAVYTPTRNDGPSSSDRGLAVKGTACPRAEKPTAAQVATSVGNLNLNCLVDTEDNGASKITVNFASGVNRLFFTERGMNSILRATVNTAGGLSQLITMPAGGWFGTGINITTKEIKNNKPDYLQEIGSRLFAVDGDLVTSIDFDIQSSDNGPDFKVIGAKVPEPATLTGLGLVAGAAFFARRKKQAEAGSADA